MLYTSTASKELLTVLNTLMKIPSLSRFRLVGGTALSLQLGHRKSDDIDFFTNQDYGSIDFKTIEEEISHHFPYTVNDDVILGIENIENHFGLHLHVGIDADSSVKTDILNWSVADFIDAELEIDGIRMATIKEIALMKLDAISRGGRKKDFWDLSEILDHYSLSFLLDQYQVKYPFNELADVKRGLLDFEIAENMPDPICLRGKYWENVKEDIKAAADEL
jgi:predicted nucleotidyltransferase component of viral defense system